MKKLLTIGVPTFNRLNTLKRCLENLKNINQKYNVEILIIDNSSTDGSYQYLKKFTKRSKIRISQNTSNLGFSGNTIELIKKCKTEYLLWCPDEDDLIEENLSELLKFLITYKPSLICPQYFINKKIYRGEKIIRKISPRDIWRAVGHLPGIILHVPSCSKFIEKIKLIKDNYPITYKYYPQILITPYLLLKENCFYWDRPICQQIDELEETHDLDKSGYTYDSLNIRWQIHREVIKYLESLLEISNNKFIIAKLLKNQKIKLYSTIRNAIGYESEDELFFFDIGALIGCLKIILRFSKKLTLSPKSIIKKVIKFQ